MENNEIGNFEMKKYKVFNYKMLTIVEHFKHFALALIVPSIIFIGSIFRDMSMAFVFFTGCVCIGCWSYWWRRLKRENNMPTFEVNEDGLEVSFPYHNESHHYNWDMLTSVELISPFVRGSKGLLEELEGRPGYELSFSDSTKVMVYQRIDGYYEFYQELASHNVSGVKDKLPYYDRLNIYGQSIDGAKWFLNKGEPAYSKSIQINK